MGQSFSTVALSWTTSRPLALPKQLGDGMDIALLEQGLQRLIDCDGVGAVVLFGSRTQGTARADSDLDLAVICQEPELTSQQRAERWRTYRNAIGRLGCGVDLVLQGQADAARLAAAPAGTHGHDHRHQASCTERRHTSGLQEFLRFRHLVRNPNADELRLEPIQRLSEQHQQTCPKLEADITAFRAWLKQLLTRAADSRPNDRHMSAEVV